MSSAIGTPIAELIAHCGGYNEGVARLIAGGSMMGYALPDDETPITKATNCQTRRLCRHALATARDLVFRTRMDTIRSWFDCSFEVTDESGRTVLLMLFDEVVPDPQARSAQPVFKSYKALKAAKIPA